MQDFSKPPVPVGAHPGGEDLFVFGARQWPTKRLIDITIRGGRIAAIEDHVKGAKPEGVPSVNGTGLCVIPGLVDVHVHFRDPGLERKEGWVRG